MSSPFRESETVTCVGCGDGVPREKTDVTERGNVCERCLKVVKSQEAGDVAAFFLASSRS